MCYFHFKAVCWWGNGKNMPSSLAKGKLFCVLQDVTALSPVPSALTGAEETLCERHCLDWAEGTLQHLVFHLPLFRAWQDVHWASWSAGSQRGYRGQLLAAEFEVPSYLGRVLSSAPAGRLEVDVANGSVWVNRREQAKDVLKSFCARGVFCLCRPGSPFPVSLSGCSPSSSFSGPPDSHLHEKTS